MQATTFQCGGTELAKVLWYYGLLPHTSRNEYKIVCPFHGDINPSMLINLNEGTFFCFGCYESGDALKFVFKAEEQLDDLSALKRYFEILKSEKCKHIKVRKRIQYQTKNDKQLYAEAYDYYHGLAKVDWRRTEDEDIQQCREYMRRRGFKPSTLQATQAKFSYNNTYKLIMPMIDNGKFKGWVSRTFDEKTAAYRKYLYNEGFSRATTLVGEYSDVEVLFVVEGYMDRLRFIQNGITNVVAILGWKMSDEQMSKIKKSKVSIVVSALDNDECGKRGSDYLASHFEHYVRFRYKRGIKDPGEMSDKQFRQMYKQTLLDVEKEKAKIKSLN